MDKLMEMLSSHQIRAGRSLVRWSSRVLAEQAGVNISTIQRMESIDGEVRGNVATLLRVQHALETAGVVFTGTSSRPGVQLRLSDLQALASRRTAAKPKPE